MFTGITRGLYTVVVIERKPGILSYEVALGESLIEGLVAGASVAIDGVCQTVVALNGDRARFDAIQESLDKSTLDTLEVGRLVSVERSMRVGDEIGGHEVAGHVSGTGEIVEVERDDENVVITLRCRPEWMRFILPKGFIAVDGSSLTVGDTCEDGRFRLHLIPETLRLTNLGTKRKGDRVNIELDHRTVAIVQTVERVLAERER